MSEPVSSRAQAILDAVERAAAEHAAATRGATGPAPARPARPAAPPPAVSPGTTSAIDRLLALVHQTVAAIDDTEARLDALRLDVDRLSRAEPPPGPAPPPAPEPADSELPDEPGIEEDPEPEEPAPGPDRPSAADILRAAGHEREPLRGSGPSARPMPPKGAVRRASEGPEADEAAPAAVASGENLSSTARLVAIEMAVSGGTRLQVEKRLHDEFGIADTHAIVDDVFGPDTAPGTRMPWGRRP